VNLFTKLWLLGHVIKWRLTWNRRNTHYRYTVPGNPKFMGPRDAARLIPDGSTVMLSGLGGNARPSILYWAMREFYAETGRPRGLTVMSVGGIGGRGKAPGTPEELAQEGLCTRFFSGHLETFKSLLRLADAGKLELQCIPQGIMTFLLDGQSRGEESIALPTGVGTFVDPRTGRGTPVVDGKAPQFVAVEGDRLRFTMPKVDVAMFNLPAADTEGNLYATNAAVLAECRDATLAARRNGGLVIANVGLIVEKQPDRIFIPADQVDAVVQYPRTEQTASVLHRRHWPLFTLDSDMSLDEGAARLKFINQILGLTPRRGPVDDAVARLAASVFAANGRPGMYVNVGVGLPEEVCRLIHQGGLTREITLFTESGVEGGLPAPGIFFGAAVSPERMVGSSQVFKNCYRQLDAAILGILEADRHGNVNVSKRGEGAINYVGPGGFVDLTCTARMVVFVGAWMAHARMAIRGGKLSVEKPGAHKFLDRVSEITFSGPEAVKAGKKVFYCTNVGAFRLTARGMELMCVMPGVDVRRDILEACPMKVVLPESGEVPVVDDSIVTGRGFELRYGQPGEAPSPSTARRSAA
jgi:propionate CoA-transferase